MMRARSLLRAALLASVVTCHARTVIAPATGRASPLATGAAINDPTPEEKTPMTDPTKPRVRTVAHFDPNDIHAIVQQAAFPNRQGFQVSQFVNPPSQPDPSAAPASFDQPPLAAPTNVVRDNQPPPASLDLAALSTNTKIAIGAGAAALLGSAIYFARKGKS